MMKNFLRLIQEGQLRNRNKRNKTLLKILNLSKDNFQNRVNERIFLEKNSLKRLNCFNLNIKILNKNQMKQTLKFKASFKEEKMQKQKLVNYQVNEADNWVLLLLKSTMHTLLTIYKGSKKCLINLNIHEINLSLLEVHCI